MALSLNRLDILQICSSDDIEHLVLASDKQNFRVDSRQKRRLPGDLVEVLRHIDVAREALSKLLDRADGASVSHLVISL